MHTLPGVVGVVMTRGIQVFPYAEGRYLILANVCSELSDEVFHLIDTGNAIEHPSVISQPLEAPLSTVNIVTLSK